MTALARRPALSRRTLALATLVLVAAGLLALPSLAARLVHRPAVELTLGTIRTDPLLRAAIEAQNLALAARSPAEDEALDAAWMAERAAGGGPLIAEHLARPASVRLRAILAGSRGAVTHTILMDDHGRNVAVAWPASDYLQGDEPKWQETFGRPPGTRHVSVLEPGFDAPRPVCWVSEPVHDPSGRPIGAVAVEVDLRHVRGAPCRMP